MKTIIAGIGFVLTMVGASCDMRVVAAVVLIGCFFMWNGGKDYESETEAQEKEGGVHWKLDIGLYLYTLFDWIGNSFSKAK